MSTVTEYSNYEVRQIGVKPSGEEAYIVADCVGTFEDEMEVKVVTKNCRGVPRKVRPRGTGNGTITASLHMPVAIYKAMYALERDDLEEGVLGYGENNLHQSFSLVADVRDEDNNRKFLAYPNCIMQTGPNMNVENGADDVAEAEVEISVMPDENGYGKYESFEGELTDETIKTTWMTDFTPELVAKTETA